MEYLGVIMAGLFFVSLVVLYFLYLTKPSKTVGSKKAGGVNSSQVSQKWQEVKAMQVAGGPANFRQAIVEADKLVDMVLKSKVKGETMGERLKAAKNLFSKDTYNALWTAHKIRNKVVHEADFEGLSSDTELALRGFEKALKELKATY